MDIIARLLKESLRRFFRNGGFFLAAAVAFFASISVFPLLLLGFIALLLFFRAGVAEPTILAIANGLIPNGATFLRQLIEERVRATSEGLLGALALIYAGMGVFGALQYALDRSFEVKKPRSYKRFLLTSLTMTLVTGVLIVVTGLFRVFAGIFEGLASAVSPGLAVLLSLLSEVVLLGAFFALITLIYIFVPTERRSFRAVWPGALFATVSVYIAQVIFSISLKHTSIPFIFGSLTAVIALLIWLDVTAILIVLGAEIAASWTK